jgi:hypothetical protein
VGYNEQYIAAEIVAYIKSCRCSPDSWYAGVTSDLQRCLRFEHNMSATNTLCTCTEVSSFNMACDVVSLLINQYGLNGKTNVDGDEHSTYVYAFLKTSSPSVL